MARVLEIADNIYQIHPELNFMFCLSYLALGERSALIDPGSTAQTQVVLRALEEELKFDPATLSYIIPTHLHVDHCGGTGLMAERSPKAKVLVAERQARYAVAPAKLIDANKQTFGANFADKFGPILPVPEDRVFPVNGSERIDLGGRTLEVIFSRGHANHHLCLLDSGSDGLFCGDALGMYYPEVDGVVIICPQGFDLTVALQTIDALRDRHPALLFYAHEGTGRNPEELMDRAAKQLNECGEMLLKAMKAGESSKQMEERLNAYFKKTVSPKLRYEKMYLDLTVAGYRRYFTKEGLVPAKGGSN